MEFYGSIAIKIKTIPRFFQPLYEYALPIPNVSNVLLEKGADVEVLRAQLSFESVESLCDAMP